MVDFGVFTESQTGWGTKAHGSICSSRDNQVTSEDLQEEGITNSLGSVCQCSCTAQNCFLMVRMSLLCSSFSPLPLVLALARGISHIVLLSSFKPDNKKIYLSKWALLQTGPHLAGFPSASQPEFICSEACRVLHAISQYIQHHVGKRQGGQRSHHMWTIIWENKVPEEQELI